MATPDLLRLFAAGGLVLAAAPLGAAPARDERGGARLYSAKVRPLLARHCVSCHGEAVRQGGLRLDTRAGILAGGGHGRAVVPGDPDASLLVRAVRRQGELKMPPGGRLADAEVALLADWVRQGAAGEDDSRAVRTAHWAFRPLRPVTPPRLKRQGGGFTPMDRFIRAKLDARGLSAAPHADRRTLIRRATFDLTGLPPTPTEIAAFVGDRRPGAYERLIDRLLASPRYGERWGRHWLDVVHYGDTHGYDKDKRRDNAWPYRDYVIRSLNRDLPYGWFIREQIAGDVLRPGDPEGVIATGFIAAGPWDFVGHVELREGTAEKAKTRLLDRDDMVANSFATFNSLTVHCARCHDHKFDPIPQREYYALQAVFAGVERGDRLREPRPMVWRRTALQTRQKEIEERQAALFKQSQSLTNPEIARLDAEIRRLREELVRGARPLGSGESPTNGYHGAVEPVQDREQWVQVDLGRSLPIDEIRLIPARPTDFRDTPGFGFPIRYRIALADDPEFATSHIVADRTAADVPNPGDEAVLIPAGNRVARFVRVTATRLWPRDNQYLFALAEMEVASGGRNVALGAAVTSPTSIEEGRWSAKHLVDGYDSRSRLPDGGDPGVGALRRQRAAIVEAIQKEEVTRRALHARQVEAELGDDFARAREDLAAVERERAALPPPKQVYAAISRAPRPIHLLTRGDVEQPADAAAPGALACVPGLDSRFRLADTADEGSRRAALAEWIASPKNPLTWRSIVNRVWHYHFGRGLVDTPSDFGRNGSMPTHPKLLDWLAIRFRDGGQSLKSLHRLIMLSAVYRQSSRYDPASARVDADNRLIWRMNRQRLDAESIRDSVLAVSGTLDLTMGGPGFELFRFKDDHSPVYDHSAPEKINDPAGRRRAVYRFVVRSVPNPFIECLDGADPNLSTPVRTTTLTALQALALLNDPFILEQARHFARRLERAAPDRAGQIQHALLLAFGRAPTPDEREALLAHAGRHGLAHLCRLLFNTNEFLFVD